MIKIGNTDISAFKVGDNDVDSIYLGSNLIYRPTLEWVSFTTGDTIPSTKQIYGVSGNVESLSYTFNDMTQPFYVSDIGRNKFEIWINNSIYETVYYDDTINYTFSDMGFQDPYITTISAISVNAPMQLLIYN